jgi:hypothetical protein
MKMRTNPQVQHAALKAAACERILPDTAGAASSPSGPSSPPARTTCGPATRRSAPSSTGSAAPAITRPRVLAVGDGALAFWSALREVFPEIKEGRCWLHKTAGVGQMLAFTWSGRLAG